MYYYNIVKHKIYSKLQYVILIFIFGAYIANIH